MNENKQNTPVATPSSLSSDIRTNGKEYGGTHYRAGSVIDKRYGVHQIITGGMGEVYLCLDLETSRPYALKTFKAKYLSNPKIHQLFEQEVGTWVSLEKHPNIVRCFYLQTIDQIPFMFLEWVIGDQFCGTDLRSFLKNNPLELRFALDIMIDICRGLIHANNKQPGIVHRDLKPENILITLEKSAKITDFGLATIAQQAELEIETEFTDERQSLLQFGSFVGTPAYAAPELWQPEKVDARADIYAVGCMLYEILTKERPFQIETETSTPIDKKTRLDTWRNTHETVPPPHLSKDFPDRINDIVQTCLQKEPDKRFASFWELLQEFSNVYQSLFAEEPHLLNNSSDFTPSDYIARGLTYEKLQKYDKALEDYNQALELAPHYALAYNNRGSVYAELQQYDNAIADFNHAIREQSNYAEAYANRGAAYGNINQHKKALKDLTQSIEIEPHNAHAYYNRGIVYDDLQQHEKALKDFTRAIEFAPNHEFLYARRAKTYLQRHKYEEALEDYTEAIRCTPTNAHFYIERGNIYGDLQQNKEAVDDYTEVIRTTPDSDIGYYNRGKIYFTLQKYDEAIEDFTEAIRLNPEDAANYNNRGSTYSQLKRYDEALADFVQAIHLDPNHVSSYVNIAIIYAAQDKHNEALEYYAKAFQIDPDYSGIYYNRGLTYIAFQDNRKALKDFNRTIQLNPENTQAYFFRGLMYYDLEEYENARNDFIKATQLDINYAEAYYGLGITLPHINGQIEEALLYFEKAGQLGYSQAARDTEEIYREIREPYQQINLAVHYTMNGELQKAADCYKKALDKCRRKKESVGETLSLLGLSELYLNFDDHEHSIEFCKQALELSRKFNFQQVEAQCLGTLGDTYEKRGDIETAIGYYEQRVIVM